MFLAQLVNNSSKLFCNIMYHGCEMKTSVDALMTREQGELHAVVIVLQMEYFQNGQ